MLINVLFSNPLMFLIYTVALLVAVTVHEFSHAWVADYLGDPTARLAGRVSLNPLAHLDLLGTIFLLFVGFGWGKPVPVDTFNLRNPQKDEAIIALAGPFSNFVLASLLSLIVRAIYIFLPSYASIASLLIPIIYLNVILGVFNVLPVYPLDGYNIVAGILPEEKREEWNELRRYGFIFLLLLILPFGKSSLLDMIFPPIVSFFMKVLVPHF